MSSLLKGKELLLFFSSDRSVKWVINSTLALLLIIEIIPNMLVATLKGYGILFSNYPHNH